MSCHSTNYLNRKMKKGNAAKTGYAWWYDKNAEDPNNPSHYDGFIPLPVVREFFVWNAEESIQMVATFRMAEPPAMDEQGNPLVPATPAFDENGDPVLDGAGRQYWDYTVPVQGHKALGRSNWIAGGIPEGEEAGASKILSVVDEDYGVHQAKEIFITNVADLVGGADNIGVESIGELKWGRRLFASVSIPENLLNKESGLEFRPILTICTSFDRTLATKYVRTFGVPVCDNTLNYELTRAGEKDGHFVIRHTKNSASRLGDAKKVLGLLNESADEFDAWATGLAQAPVPEDKFLKWLDVMVPIPEIKRTMVTVKSIQGEDVQVEKVSSNAQTIALKKRDKLVEMWDKDPRVAPWKGTRLGILQLWNTYLQHEASFKGTKAAGGDKVAARAELNMNKMIECDFAKEDTNALRVISNIMADDEPVMVAVPAGAPTATATKQRPRTRKSAAGNNG